MDIWTVYRILMKHKWAIILSTAITVGVALFAYSLLPIYYEATATMMPSDRVLMHPTTIGTAIAPLSDEQRDERVSTLAAMAQSRTICAIACKKLNLKISPSELQSKLTVNRVIDNQDGRQTNLLKLKVLMDEPEKAVIVANTLAESFCDFYDKVSHKEATENRKFLEEQLQEARRKLDLADERLRSFRGHARIANLNTQIEADLKVLADLKSQRDSAMAQLSEVTGNLAAVSRQIAQMSSSKTTVEMTSEGSATADLKARIAQMEKDLALLRSRYTPKHPKIIQLETTLARARDELNRTSNQMTQRIVVTANPEYEALQSQKRDLEAKQAAGQARVAALDRAIREREKQLSKYPSTDVELSRRALESKTAQEAYSSILARWNQARIDESLTTETGAIQIIDHAEKASGPIRKEPDRIQLIIASILFGIAIGAGYSLLTEKLDVSIRTVEDARSLIDLPVVGVIPTLEPAVSATDAPRLTDLNPVSPYAESYRFLGTDLLLSAEQDGIKSIMIATAKPHQGGTVTICNLAITLAQAGKQVILVDADFRRPQLHRVFTVANKPGLSDALSNGMPISEALHQTHIPNLKLIPSGTNPDNPWKLLRSQRFVEIMDELKAMSDFVLFDSPSAMVFADAITISSLVDGVIVVIRANQPPRGNELQLKHLLNKANANIIGVVLNAVSPHLTDSICFHDYYYSSPSQGKSRLAISGSQGTKNTTAIIPKDEDKQA